MLMTIKWARATAMIQNSSSNDWTEMTEQSRVAFFLSLDDYWQVDILYESESGNEGERERNGSSCWFHSSDHLTTMTKMNRAWCDLPSNHTWTFHYQYAVFSTDTLFLSLVIAMNDSIEVESIKLAISRLSCLKRITRWESVRPNHLGAKLGSMLSRGKWPMRDELNTVTVGWFQSA